jgi:hypothetical protein
MISCRDWWQWTKRSYVTTTRRQSNSQWSGGSSPPPKKKKNSSAKIGWKSFRLDFLEGIKMASTSLIIFKRANLRGFKAEYYSSLLV